MTDAMPSLDEINNIDEETLDFRQFLLYGEANIVNVGDQNHLLSILNQKIRNIGILPYGIVDLTDNNVAVLIRLALDLLGRYQKLASAYDELRDKHRRVSSDLSCAQRSNIRLKDVIGQHEKTVWRLQENQMVAAREMTALNKKIKSSQDEIKYLISVAQTREAQQRNDGRKKAVEINKLKDRLDALLNIKVTGNGLRQRTSQNEVIPKADSYQKETKYAKDRLLVIAKNENENLRRILAGVYCQLEDAITEITSKKPEPKDVEVSGENGSDLRTRNTIDKVRFNFPLTKSVSAKIEADFRLMIVHLNKKL